MAYPTVTKTYDFTYVNQVMLGTGNADQDYRNIWLAWKNSLIGFAQNPWTVIGSSDGTTAAMDGVDRWTDTSKIVYGENFSWIVLENPVNGAQIMAGPSNYWIYGYAYFSYGGGFGKISGGDDGSTSSIPQATDQIGWFGGNNNNVWHNDGNSFNSVLHVVHSTDGKITRWWLYTNNRCISFADFSEIKNPIPEIDSPPLVSKWLTDNSGATQTRYDQFYNQPLYLILFDKDKASLEGTVDLTTLAYGAGGDVDGETLTIKLFNGGVDPDQTYTFSAPTDENDLVNSLDAALVGIKATLNGSNHLVLETGKTANRGVGAYAYIQIVSGTQINGNNLLDDLGFTAAQVASSTWRYAYCHLTSEGMNQGGPLGRTMVTANTIDGKYPFFPIGLFGRPLPSQIGKHGEIFDMWWGLEANNEGDWYPDPNDATKLSFIQVGDFILPWINTSGCAGMLTA